MIAIGLPSDYHRIAIGLPSDCDQIAIGLPSDYHRIAIGSPGMTTDDRLSCGALMTTDDR
jgi:hypothetical protein